MLLRFLMKLVLVAAWAVLLPLDALRMQALVLRGEVIPVLALAAGENDFLSRHRTTGSRVHVQGCQPTASLVAADVQPKFAKALMLRSSEVRRGYGL